MLALRQFQSARSKRQRAAAWKAMREAHEWYEELCEEESRARHGLSMAGPGMGII